MIITVVRLWLFVFACLVASVRTSARTWEALYAFGDSYTDSGAGYVDGNGPTAVVYLAAGLGISFTHAADLHSKGKSLNFAVSGADTGDSEGQHMKNALLGRGMMSQVRDFVQRVRTGAVRFDPEKTLFFLAGGINDAKLPTSTTVANVLEEIQLLYAAGGRYFLVAEIPTLPNCRETGLRLNPALARIPAKIPELLPSAHVAVSRWGEYFDQVFRHAGDYGITNTTDACAGRALFNEDSTPRGNPDSYFYYHEGHPSTVVHRIVGRELEREVKELFP